MRAPPASRGTFVRTIFYALAVLTGVVLSVLALLVSFAVLVPPVSAEDSGFFSAPSAGLIALLLLALLLSLIYQPLPLK